MPISSEIQLPLNNIENLFIEHQDAISKVVDVFIRRNTFPRNEKQDIIQNINEILLQRKEKIAQQFKGESTFRTYLYTIVRNICLRMASKYNSPVTYTENEIEHAYTVLPDNKIIIKQELERFEACIKLVTSQRNRLEFLLKVKFRIPVEKYEMKYFNPVYSTRVFEDVFLNIENYKQATDNELFSAAASLINQNNHKQINANSLIKWINTKMKQIIQLLNGNPKRADFTEETLNILVEIYFRKRSSIGNELSIHETFENNPTVNAEK